MLTPFDVEDIVKRIRVSEDTKSDWFLTNSRITNLYLNVLEEIEKGSIDPKSLAHAALRLRPSWAKGKD